MFSLKKLFFHVLFSGMAKMNIFHNLNFSLGAAHVTHMPNVLDICDVMSVWSWANVFFVLILTMCTVWQHAHVSHM